MPAPTGRARGAALHRAAETRGRDPRSSPPRRRPCGSSPTTPGRPRSHLVRTGRTHSCTRARRRRTAPSRGSAQSPRRQPARTARARTPAHRRSGREVDWPRRTRDQVQRRWRALSLGPPRRALQPGRRAPNARSPKRAGPVLARPASAHRVAGCSRHARTTRRSPHPGSVRGRATRRAEPRTGGSRRPGPRSRSGPA